MNSERAQKFDALLILFAKIVIVEWPVKDQLSFGLNMAIKYGYTCLKKMFPNFNKSVINIASK